MSYVNLPFGPEHPLYYALCGPDDPPARDERHAWVSAHLAAWVTTGRRSPRDTPAIASGFAAKLGFMT